MQCHYISFHDQQNTVSDTAFVFLDHPVSLHFIPWPTVCEWQCICFFWPSSLIAYHLLTNSLWVILHLFFLTIQSHCISSHDQQYVSDTAFGFFFWPSSLIASHPMTNREWVTLYLFFLTIQSHCGISSHDQQYVSDTAFVFLYYPVSLWHFIPWPTGSELHCICFSWSLSLIAFHPTTKRLWVIPHFMFYHVSQLHFIPWPTGSEWHCICFSWPSSLIASHPMTNSLWVTLHLFLLTIQSHCGISSHDQQNVSDTAFVFLDHLVSLHLIPWPTGSEWHCICFSWPSSLTVAFHPMTNSMWVTLHLFFLTIQSHCGISSHDQQGVSYTAFVFLDHSVSLHFIPQPKGCESYHILCFTMFHNCLSSHGQQSVSLHCILFFIM